MEVFGNGVGRKPSAMHRFHLGLGIPQVVGDLDGPAAGLLRVITREATPDSLPLEGIGSAVEQSRPSGLSQRDELRCIERMRGIIAGAPSGSRAAS